MQNISYAFYYRIFRTRWLSNENKMHTKNPKQVSESAAASGENFMHTKGWRSPTCEKLVHPKYSGFTVGPAHKSQATRNPDGNLFVKAWMEDARVSKNAKFRRLCSYLRGSYPIGMQTYFFEGIFPKSKWCSGKLRMTSWSMLLTIYIILYSLANCKKKKRCQVGWSILSIGLLLLFYSSTIRSLECKLTVMD